ncbi:MAG TPA: hypothetical protein VK171_06630 [Fimbriimonas sp.]|nr:hypothetical protein [Fimbriimonas sp.]
MPPKVTPIRTTLAVAKNAPVAVVCVVMSSNLSRLYFWNLETDEWIPGQFLKAEASIQDISSDGKCFSYVAYGKMKPWVWQEAANYGKSRYYICLAKPPYFSALFLFQVNGGESVNFIDDETIGLSFCDSGHWGNSLEYGCPWTLKFEVENLRPAGFAAFDHVNDRQLIGLGDRIVTRDVDGNDQLVKQFVVEPFESMPPPDWATRW